MRRVYTLIGIWFAVAAVATVAFGSSAHVSIVGAPKSLVAGEPYVVNVKVKNAWRRWSSPQPIVRLRDERGYTVVFHTAPIGSGTYRAEVSVPAAGHWSVAVSMGSKTVAHTALDAKGAVLN
jgi:hypothetical protein